MLSSHCIEELFGFKDAIIKNIENDAHHHEIHIYFELERSIVSCPHC